MSLLRGIFVVAVILLTINSTVLLCKLHQAQPSQEEGKEEEEAYLLHPHSGDFSTFSASVHQEYLHQELNSGGRKDIIFQQHQQQQYSQPHKNQHQTIADLTSFLESTADSIRYFVYNDSEITLPHIRKRCKTNQHPQRLYTSTTVVSNKGNPIKMPRKIKWAVRYIDYSKWDLLHLETLERHDASLRTQNPNEADFFLVPIPFGASAFWGDGDQAHVQALEYLFQRSSLYRQFGSKRPHVILTTIEFLFRPNSGRAVDSFFNKHNGSQIRQEALQKLTIVKFDDIPAYQYGLRHAVVPSPDFESGIAHDNSHLQMKHTWSISYAGAASRYGGQDEVNFKNLDAVALVSNNNTAALLGEWKKRRLHYFYSTRLSPPFLKNSTQYRHALFLQDKQRLIQPSSVGFDLPREKWIRDFASAKFCLSIRGDTPSSRSLLRSIRNGCIPVIVMDLLPYFSPMFRSLIRYTDFGIMVPEQAFLADPVGVLERATHHNLSQPEIEAKLQALALVQRMVVVDHPRSLFVQAFCRETMASSNPQYNNFSLWYRPYYGDDMDHNAFSKMYVQ